jgi:hypothetical protein
VPSRVKSNKIEVGLEFEWLLCLASTLQTAQRFRPAEDGKTRRHVGLARIKSHHLLVGQTGRAPKVVRQHWAVLEITY